MAKVTIPNLPGVRSLINGTGIVASAEKAQIESISVERSLEVSPTQLPSCTRRASL